ncbi:hypothetical protein BC828DRAFT_373999 [Blastocladiella britannica]|nr:hypothetical protein BC828DRAFT_373999 [Blastocladiella britannica]
MSQSPVVSVPRRADDPLLLQRGPSSSFRRVSTDNIPRDQSSAASLPFHVLADSDEDDDGTDSDAKTLDPGSPQKEQPQDQPMTSIWSTLTDAVSFFSATTAAPPSEASVEPPVKLVQPPALRPSASGSYLPATLQRKASTVSIAASVTSNATVHPSRSPHAQPPLRSQQLQTPAHTLSSSTSSAHSSFADMVHAIYDLSDPDGLVAALMDRDRRIRILEERVRTSAIAETASARLISDLDARLANEIARKEHLTAILVAAKRTAADTIKECEMVSAAHEQEAQKSAKLAAELAHAEKALADALPRARAAEQAWSEMQVASAELARQWQVHVAELYNQAQVLVHALEARDALLADLDAAMDRMSVAMRPHATPTTKDQTLQDELVRASGGSLPVGHGGRPEGQGV